MSRRLELVCAALCAALVLAAVVSLTRYPDPFDDEGLYAALGRHFVQTGVVQAPELTQLPPFDVSDGTCNREAPAIFGIVGKWTGYTLATARAISLVQILLSVVVFFFAAVELGVSGWLGALLFFSTERIFYAAHVFRPEASLVLVNTVFIYLIARAYRRGGMSDRMSFGRGLLNAPFVMAHGNGLTSAIINSIEMLASPWCGRKRIVRVWLLYFAGSCAAIAIFYLTHVRDIGWSKFFDQLSLGAPQAQAKGGIWDTIVRDLTIRWGRELIVVGNSASAKVLRFFFYGVILATALWSLFRYRGVARRMAALALGCVVAYIFVVHDKIDIHIAEMIPYFIGSLLAWFVAARGSLKRYRWVPATVLTSVLLTGLSLCLHHTVKYRGETLAEQRMRPVNEYLATQKIRPRYENFIGEMEYWFTYQEGANFYGLRYSAEHLPLHGGVIAIGRDFWHKQRFVACKLDYADPNNAFKAFSCPE